MCIDEGAGGIYPFIFRLWVAGTPPREIAARAGVPIEEIYRLLRLFEKDLVKKGVENYGEKIHI
jgi:hypothetical protein